MWADNFRALTGIFSQIFGPSLAIWANPVQFLFQGIAPAGSDPSLEAGKRLAEALDLRAHMQAIVDKCESCWNGTDCLSKGNPYWRSDAGLDVDQPSKVVCACVLLALQLPGSRVHQQTAPDHPAEGLPHPGGVRRVYRGGPAWAGGLDRRCACARDSHGARACVCMRPCILG